MAKPSAGKMSNKIDTAVEEVKAEPEVIVKENTDKPETTVAVTSNPKKDLSPSRPKKQTVLVAKNGFLLPSAHKLEHLKAAVTAAGNAEKLLLILHYVEEAGGKSEVTESIEAYRVLRTVLEE